MRYEIIENGVYGYAPEQEEPILIQPTHPDGRPFADEADASAWGELWLAHMTDPANNDFPESTSTES